MPRERKKYIRAQVELVSLCTIPCHYALLGVLHNKCYLSYLKTSKSDICNRSKSCNYGKIWTPQKSPSLEK